LSSILDTIGRWFGRGKAVQAEGLSEDASRLMLGLSTSRNSPRRGTEELIQAYRQIPMLRAIVQRIAENIASVPWTVHRINGRGGKAIRARGLERMPMALREKAVARAVRAGDAQELDEDPILDLLDAGNDSLDGFATRQVMATHLELKGEAFAWLERNPVGMPIAMWPMPPQWVRNVPAPGQDTFELSIGGNITTKPRRDVLYIRDPDPENPYGRGTGIGESLGDELDTSEYASAFVKHFFYNDATPDFLLGFPAAEQVSTDQLKEMRVIWEEQHRGAKRARAPHMLNAAPNVHEFGASFKDLGVVELQKFMRSVCRETWGLPPEIMGLIDNSNRATIESAGYLFALWILVPRLERMRVALQKQLVPQFDDRKLLGYVSPVPEDKAFALQVATANTASRTRNEWREMQGLDGRGPEDDVYLQSAILIERPAPTPPAARARARGKSFVVKVEGSGAPITPEQIDPILAQLKPKRLTDETRGLWEEQLEAWGQEALDELGVDISFDMLNPLVSDHLEDFSSTRIKGINDTTRDAIRAQLREGVEAGEGYLELAARIKGVFTDCDQRRAETIARTEAMRSSNFAEHEAQAMSGVVEAREWIATPDDRAREDHLAINGQVRKLDEPFEFPDGTPVMFPGDSGDPAQDINCMLPGTVVQGAIVAGTRMLYDGPVIAIKTAGGRRLSVTPNHQVLTGGGFVPASLVRKGDYLVCYGPNIKPTGRPPDHVNQPPAMVEEVFGALAALGTKTTVGRYAEQLHGDAEFGKGNIEVVDVLGTLKNNADPASIDRSAKGDLPAAEKLASSFTGYSLPLKLDDRCRPATAGDVGGSNLESPGGGTLAGPLQKFRLGPASDLHPELPEPGLKTSASDPGLVAKLLERGSGAVLLDQVVEVGDGTWSGHVYDLQSTTGWIVADSIIIRNCRCTTAAHFDEKDLAQDKRLAKWKAFDAKLGSWERAAKAAFRRGFEAQRDDVLDALRDAAGV